MSERRGIWSILEYPVVYETFHTVIGARRWMERFARETIRPKDGDSILDIGCGTGALLQYLPNVSYIGVDYSEANIAKAQRVHGDRGRFIRDDVGNLAQHGLKPVDIAIAYGVIHHIDDDTALRLLRSTANMLKPGGRLITVDPALHREQSFVQRAVVRMDRGVHVRPFDDYVALCGSVFPESRAEFRRGYVPFPHSLCIIQAEGHSGPTL